MEIKPGKYQIDYSEGGKYPDAKKKTIVHVRGEIDGHLVCREWTGRRWFYHVAEKKDFAFMIKNGIMTKGK